ncbi:MAG: GntR family transcriptional regulator [Tissierellia bacterium]|nr:GntR family transcriptional regulator [Tissierellia bacterium]
MLEFNNNIPIYLQVIERIKQDIVSGKLKSGEKMLSSREYSNELGINFNTVARVYKELEMEEIVFTKRGLGTFITESDKQIEELRYTMAKNRITSFIEGMKQLGYTKKDMIKFLETENNYTEGNE